MDRLPGIGTQVWIGPKCGPVYQGRPYRFLVTGVRDTGAGTALITGHRAGVDEEPYPLPVQLDGLEPATRPIGPMVGTLPATGDIIRIDPRAEPGLPAGAWLRVIGTRPCTIPAWTYVDLHVLDETGEPARETSALVPIASITLYPDGMPAHSGGQP
jgi:hypothetical protein